MMQIIKHFMLLAYCLLVFWGCEDSFRPDPVDPRLPKYSEEGKNVAGALVNGRVWRVVRGCSILWCSNDLQLEYYDNGMGGVDSVGLAMNGGFFTNEPDANMLFVIKGPQNATLSGLPELVGVYELDGIQHKAYYNSCLAQRGRLEIRHAGKKGDQNSMLYILSGTFSLYVQDGDCGVTAVEYGRFDFSLN